MIRPIVEETMRYGHMSHAGEFVYDHPFQFGSKRTGPDLARIGGKYPDFWHYRHMIDPRTTSPGSIMPSYSWLADQTVKVDGVADKLTAMQHLGVPYDDAMVANAKQVYMEQAEQIKGRLAADGVSIAADSQLVAMIAYLQRLGVDGKQAFKEEASTAAKADAASQKTKM